MGDYARFCHQCQYRLTLPFQYIIPCGIKDKAVTSLKRELEREIDVEEVKEK